LESVRLQGRRNLMNARFRLIEEAFAESLKRLTELANDRDSRYTNSLERLVIEAAEGIAGQELEVIAHPRDANLVKQKLKRLEREISRTKAVRVVLKMSDEPLRSIGGIVVRTKDGKEIFNNTLEARLAKVKQEMLVKISDIMFAGEAK
jgi:V/A-type H+-transporting ATPase subunit E